MVAPHAGSVDRNIVPSIQTKLRDRSLPTRGAWIEILIAENGIQNQQSLPTRGAWIEISFPIPHDQTHRVAPHAGSVDRNITSVFVIHVDFRRSPRGERG